LDGHGAFKPPSSSNVPEQESEFPTCWQCIGLAYRLAGYKVYQRQTQLEEQPRSGSRGSLLCYKRERLKKVKSFAFMMYSANKHVLNQYH
jgi:hypothetical protein